MVVNIKEHATCAIHIPSPFPSTAGKGPDYYWFLLGGNLAVALQNVLIWNSVAQISGMWFPPNERALSTAVVGSLGAQVW